MCGLCGFISKKKISKETLIAMNNTLEHRGPDDHGEEIYTFNGEWNVGFGHRRLSIVDLSDKGHQPMHSKDKSVTVIFNGEIYNYQELKKYINDYQFNSNCDTEVIIAAYRKWGINFVNKINGMFAIALLDREQNKIYLIRDRIGKKPLYYYMGDNGEIVWASELKAILKYPYFVKNINHFVIGKYLQKMYINAPDTIFENTYKLEPGGVLEIVDGKVNKWKYWDIAETYIETKSKIISDYEQAKYELTNILDKAISQRLVADVPVGAFLSGGYDSTLVCALAQKKLNFPLKTYSIGFENKKINEMEYAREIAKYLGTDHTEYCFEEKDLLELVNDIPTYYDEPNGDNSALPTMLVSKLAKKDVTVVLSGDGGDELFGGYNIYSTLQRAQKKYSTITLQEMELLRCQPHPSLEDRIIIEENDENVRTQTGIRKNHEFISSILKMPNNDYYFRYENKYKEDDWAQRRMLLDMESYLPDDILAKVDRASMKYSLECRCPILDREVLEYSLSLPIEFKDNDGNQKRILKDLVYKYVPRSMMERPKMGFGMPMYEWISGALREKIIDYSSTNFLTRQGIFDVATLQGALSDYLLHGDGGKNSGKNFTNIFWSYFVFQQWYEKYMI